MGVYRFNYLSENGWLNGEAPNRLAAGQGMYEASPGIDLYRSQGCLRSGYAGVATNGQPDASDKIRSFKQSMVGSAPAVRCALGYSTLGSIYKLDQETDTLSNINTVSATAADGFEIHKDRMYYARTVAIGRSTALTGALTYDDTYVTGLTASYKGINTPHPLKSWKGYLYIGDQNVLKRVLGSESTGSSGSVALTFDSDTSITALEASGSLLLIGIAQDPSFTAAANGYNTKCFLYVWNGTDRSFTDSYRFPESIITQILIAEDKTYVFGVDSLYELVGTSFKLITPLHSQMSVHTGSAISAYGSIWWKDKTGSTGEIRSYGSPDGSLPKVFSTPFVSAGANPAAIAFGSRNKLYVADTAQLLRFYTGADSAVFKSRFIHLSQSEVIDEVRIFSSSNLASGDTMDLRIYDEANSSTTIGTYSYAALGAVNKHTFRANGFSTGAPIVSGFQLGISFDSGNTNPVREVVVITKPVAQP